MSTSWQDNERLVDLLVKEATEGLSANESAELAVLARETPGVERDAMESIVAGLWTPPASQREKMPAALHDRILAAAAGKPQERDNVTPIALAPRAAAKRTLGRRLVGGCGVLHFGGRGLVASNRGRSRSAGHCAQEPRGGARRVALRRQGAERCAHGSQR